MSAPDPTDRVFIRGLRVQAIIGINEHERMHKQAVTALAAPEMKKRLAELFLVPVGDTREQFGAYLRSELAKWAHAVKISGAKVE